VSSEEVGGERGISSRNSKVPRQDFIGFEQEAPMALSDRLARCSQFSSYKTDYSRGNFKDGQE
jgi:hypothetical protein